MPTVADLQRLNALIARLAPIADAQRGELIQAENWNTLVNTLIEVARVVVTGAQNGDVPPHTHLDEVALAWLEPRLRLLLERGPLSDPAGVARVGDVERQQKRLLAQFERLASDVKDVRLQVTDVSTRDLTREADVSLVRRRLEGLGDAREDVWSLRESLHLIREDVSVAVDVGSRLIVDGEPVDMQVYNERLQNVELLRERLTGPDGELLDANTLEQRLTELTNTLVTEAELDEALDSRVVSIEEDISGLDQRVAVLEMSGPVSPELVERVARLEEQIQAVEGLDERVTTLEGRAPAIEELGQRVGGLEEQIQALGQLDQRVGSLEEQIGILDQLDQRIGSLEERIQVLDEFEQRIARVEEQVRVVDGLSARVIELEERAPIVDERLAAVEVQVARIDELEARISALEQRQAEVDRLGERVAALDERTAALDERAAILERDHVVMNRRLDALEEIVRELTGGPVGDDLTHIEGIGPAFATRLRDAGVLTFEQIARMEAEELGLILGISALRVQEARFIEHAARLAQEG